MRSYTLDCHGRGLFLPSDGNFYLVTEIRMYTIQNEDDYKVIRCCFLLGQGSSIIEVRNLLMHKYQIPPDRARAAINAALANGGIEHCDEILHFGASGFRSYWLI